MKASQEIVNTALAWINSNDGRKALLKNYLESKAKTDDLNAKRIPDPSTLNTPVTI